MSRLQHILEQGQFALTAEITPPASSDLADLLAKAAPLKGLADAVNVTDGAGARAHLESTVAAGVLLQNGIEPILQLTCRDRNRIALQSQLLGAAALGIKNLLLLKGDDPTKGDQPEAKAVFDLDSASLAATAVEMRDHGRLPHGRAIGGSADFFVGVADAPIDPPPGWRPASLIKKVESGAQFAQTQFCMDADIVRRYVARLVDSGLRGKLHLLVGVAPLASAKSARWIKSQLGGSIIPDRFVERLDRARDPAVEGRAICIDFVKQLREIAGVGGAHIMAPLNEAAIVEVIEALRAA
ncbi:MAG: methylenetetrahydrofolate reductase [Steroidobacteraceae bacterium]|jgi:methylenetetrahydrofolate reductase (NADPH)